MNSFLSYPLSHIIRDEIEDNTALVLRSPGREDLRRIPKEDVVNPTVLGRLGGNREKCPTYPLPASPPGRDNISYLPQVQKTLSHFKFKSLTFYDLSCNSLVKLPERR